MTYAPLYTVPEVSKILKINSDDVRNLIRSGKLPAIKLGSLKVRGTDLEKFIEGYPTVEQEK